MFFHVGTRCKFCTCSLMPDFKCKVAKVFQLYKNIETSLISLMKTGLLLILYYDLLIPVIFAWLIVRVFLIVSCAFTDFPVTRSQDEVAGHVRSYEVSLCQEVFVKWICIFAHTKKEDSAPHRYKRPS